MHDDLMPVPVRRVVFLFAVASLSLSGCATGPPVRISDEMVERIMSRSRVEYIATPRDDGTLIIRRR